ncbi:hypothetical protein [Cognatishimia maritima]|uniref:Uncharacterized protein n=1 Tax=Cognatishimia maritima TaxID=870908 RepID=A0A1M5U3P7_9RHOB|nr:hypothetical protein [Cognatishimia maritima]SHH57579.1 hypothetical protein SAMN04488044_2783 [Cognatishimia maritima]
MSFDLPEYFFRTFEGGAKVFRVDGNNRHGRLNLVQIATVSLPSGTFKPHAKAELSEADSVAIEAWIKDRKETLDWREIDDILRLVDQLNATADWAQTKASEAQIDMVSDTLLMAMHDLRRVLAAKKTAQ